MHHRPINAHSSVLVIKRAPIKGNENVLQDLFQWPPLRSLPIQSERNERPLLSPFIWLNDGWMDWSQLIWQWQEALLLAQWPTPTKDRNHQQNSHCPQIDFQMPTKPRRCHSKPAVSHCDTPTRPEQLTQRSRDNCGQHITVTTGEQTELFRLILQMSEVPGSTNEMQCSCEVFLSPGKAQVKCLKGGFGR